MYKNLSINITGSGTTDQIAVRLIAIGRALQVSSVYNTEINLGDLTEDGILNIGIETETGLSIGTKPTKIDRIKEIIKKWGGTTVGELSADSPCISGYGMHKNYVVTLVEGFNLNDVDVVTYNNEIDVAENTLTYEELNEDVIDEILQLLEDYDTDSRKTMERCQD